MLITRNATDVAKNEASIPREATLVVIRAVLLSPSRDMSIPWKMPVCTHNGHIVYALRL